MAEIAFPFAIDRNGGVAAATTPLDIATKHVISAVGTHPTERVMRPGYGCSSMYYLFDPSDPSITALLEAEIRRAVQEQVPEVLLSEVVALGGKVDGVLNIKLAFTLIRTGETAEVTTEIRTASRVAGLVYEEN